jgi:hypothetical protein
VRQVSIIIGNSDESFLGPVACSDLEMVLGAIEAPRLVRFPIGSQEPEGSRSLRVRAAHEFDRHPIKMLVSCAHRLSRLHSLNDALDFIWDWITTSKRVRRKPIQ